MSDVLTEVTRLVSRMTRTPDLTPDSRFDTLENWTSLTALRLFAMIEQHWHMTLNLHDYLAIQTLEDLADTITHQITVHSR